MAGGHAPKDRAHLNAAIDGISADELAAIAGQAIGQAQQQTGGLCIDLMTLVHPRNLDQAMVRSLFAESLAACDAGALAAFQQPLDRLRQAYPDDLSVAICAALLALAGNDPGRVQSTLEQSPCSSRRHRSSGWLTVYGPMRGARGSGEADPAVVSRPCVSQAGECVGEDTSVRRSLRRARAVEAAHRQEDRVWLLAMMREQGQLAFERSDRSGAAAVWSRMLDLVVTPPHVRARRTAAGAGDGRATPASKSAHRKNQNHRTRWTMTAAEMIGENINMLRDFRLILGVFVYAITFGPPTTAQPTARTQQPRPCPPPNPGTPPPPKTARTAVHAAVPLPPRTKPAQGHRSRPRLWLPRRTRIAR